MTSVEEYLKGDYRPDVDYVEGNIEERCVGELSHAELQFQLVLQLRTIIGVFACFEVRLKVSDTRYRVPDVCAYVDYKPTEQVLTRPPFVCIEVLSPEDRLNRTLTVVRDYFGMGVQNVWIMDPRQKLAYICSEDGGWRPASGQIATSDGRIVLSLNTLFND